MARITVIDYVLMHRAAFRHIPCVTMGMLTALRPIPEYGDKIL